MKKILNFCNHCFTPSHRGKEVDMVDYQKENKLTGKSGGATQTAVPCNKKWVKQVFLSKENPLKVRNSSFASLPEVDILPPCLPLQELHLLAESSFLKTLAELQLLILLEACWALGRDYQGLEVFFTRS